MTKEDNSVDSTESNAMTSSNVDGDPGVVKNKSKDEENSLKNVILDWTR